VTEAIIATESASAPAPVADAAPAPVETPAAAPAVEAPAPVAAPTVEPAPVTQTTSLISDEVSKAAEAPQPEAPAVTETAPAVEPPAVTWNDFALPEGMELDRTGLDQLKEVLGGDLSHQERGQRLVDMHLAELQRRDQMLVENQINVWNETQTQWKEAVKADPELGGNRFNTTMQTCISAVNRFGGNAEQRAELINALNFTGAGNNPAIIRLINNMASLLKEGSPMTTTAAPKAPMTREQKRYNASGAN
jgi:hypothetical protein